MGMEGIIAVVALLIGLVALARGSAGRTDAGERREEAASSGAKSASDERLERVTKLVSQLEAEVAPLGERVTENASLLAALVTDDEARHLWFLERGKPVSYDSHPALQQELRSLARRGFIQKRGDFKIHELQSPFDLLEAFELTSLGRSLLRRRSHLEQSDTAPSDSLPPGA